MHACLRGDHAHAVACIVGTEVHYRLRNTGSGDYLELLRIVGVFTLRGAITTVPTTGEILEPYLSAVDFDLDVSREKGHVAARCAHGGRRLWRWLKADKLSGWSLGGSALRGAVKR